jgi:hypothetical protein
VGARKGCFWKLSGKAEVLIYKSSRHNQLDSWKCPLTLGASGVRDPHVHSGHTLGTALLYSQVPAFLPDTILGSVPQGIK